MAETALTSRWWTLAALTIFVLFLLPIALPVLEGGPTRVVARQDRPPRVDTIEDPHWDRTTKADLRFVIWQVGRNSHTILHRPGHLFDAEMCSPAEQSLAYGPSGLTLGLLAVPFRLFTDEPVLLFNILAVGLLLVSALILFWLVREWTGLPAAGIVAAVIFTYHYIRSGDVIHLYVRDTAWTMLALFFARRLFERSRWLDAGGLAFVVLIQMGGASYPLMAAGLIAPFAGFWLWRTYGLQKLQLIQLAVVAAFAILSALLLLAPYLALEADGDLGSSKIQLFVPLYMLGPSRPGFPGFTTLALVIAAFALPAMTATGGRHPNPRWALGGATLLLLATSVVITPISPLNVAILERGALPEGTWPNLYMLLETWLPGLSLGRGPGSIYVAAHLLLAVLAGFGAAALIRRAPQRLRIHLALALIVVTSIEIMRPRVLGFHQWIGYEAVVMRPADETIELYEDLSSRMADGAILELPMGDVLVGEISRSVLQTAYHGRATSRCYASYVPKVTRKVQRLAREMPDPESLEALYALGFTGLVVHHPENSWSARRRRVQYEKFVAGPGERWLEPVAQGEELSTYLIRPTSPDTKAE